MFVRSGVTQLTPTNPALLPSSVFSSQSLCASVYLPLVIVVLFVVPGVDLEMAQVGLGVTVAATLTAIVVPWETVPVGWQRILPIMNMAAILCFAAAPPVPGLEWLVVVPAIWLATLGGRGRMWLAPLAASPAVWVSIIWQFGWPEPGRLGDRIVSAVLLPVVLVFVTVAVDSTIRRAVAPQILLERQGSWTDSALARARLDRERLRTTLDSVRFSVVRFTPEGETIMENATTRRLIRDLGLSEGTSLLAVPVYDEDGVTTLTVDRSPFSRALTGDPVERQLVWLGHPGQLRYAYEVNARAYDDVVDGPSVLVVSRDVTAEIESVRARDDLVASLSHELRTPLQAISGYLELVGEAPELSTSTSELLRVAMGGVERMQSLVSDVLYAHTRLPNQAVPLKVRDCELTELARQAVAEFGISANERLIGLHLQGRSAGVVRGDPVRLRQVVDILLSNAIKYTEFGGRVDVLVDQVEHQGRPSVQLTVVDTGRGMTPREQEGLFQPFYRAESVRSSKVHGTGLGLSIARDIVDQHRGEIVLTSDAGEGTTVVVTLPVECSEERSS